MYRLLEKNNRYIERTKRHHIYSHPTKKGKIPVGKHGTQEVPNGTLNSIMKMAGFKK
ncbi:MAG: type II toxin-antitoxin system HicA family toxin [Bacteroidales bacterium]|nr:type II toxin-antitoxin system HicA family toxin [Bacteroidales bacterium]